MFCLCKHFLQSRIELREYDWPKITPREWRVDLNPCVPSLDQYGHHCKKLTNNCWTVSMCMKNLQWDVLLVCLWLKQYICWDQPTSCIYLRGNWQFLHRHVCGCLYMCTTHSLSELLLPKELVSWAWSHCRHKRPALFLPETGPLASEVCSPCPMD